MARAYVYSGLLAGVLCGCQSTRQQACCDDCLPPPTFCGGYNSYCDNYVTTATAAKCANSDLKDLKKSCGKRSNDFEDGFRQSYIDLAMGRQAIVPPVPPRQYWTAYYRSCAGSSAVSDWFEGYRLGLTMGSQNGVSRFNRVATSLGAEGNCLSSVGNSWGTQDTIPSPDQVLSQSAPRNSAPRNSAPTNATETGSPLAAIPLTGAMPQGTLGTAQQVPLPAAVSPVQWSPGGFPADTVRSSTASPGY